MRGHLDRQLLPVLKTRAVDEITTTEILKMFNKVWQDIPATASEVWSLARRIMEEVEDVHIGEGESPFRDSVYRKIKKPKRRKTHILSVPHPLIGWAVDLIRGYTGGWNIATKWCLLFIILTACRPHEAQEMRWGELRWKKIEDDIDWGEAELDPNGDFIDQWG